MPQPIAIDDFIRNFENAVEAIEQNSLMAETAFTQLPEWDSLAALSILAMVDADYDVEISGRELRGCKTLQELFEIVRSKIKD
jgi:acyl carrier protein